MWPSYMMSLCTHKNCYPAFQSESASQQMHSSMLIMLYYQALASMLITIVAMREFYSKLEVFGAMDRYMRSFKLYCHEWVLKSSLIKTMLSMGARLRRNCGQCKVSSHNLMSTPTQE